MSVRARRRGHWVGPLLGLASAAACVTLIPAAATVEPPTSTFDRFLSQARAGDVQSRVIVGYMLATGESTTRDFALAHEWFEMAATDGSEIAGLNLAILYYLGAGVRRDPGLAERHFRLARASLRGREFSDLTSLSALVGASCDVGSSEPDVGRDVFRLFCAGCHGATGIAEYGLAPSFAFGERMEKRTDDLLSTVMHGHGSMPSWDDKLPPEWLEGALGFARSLEPRFREGILRVDDPPEAYHFRFGPMSGDPSGGGSSAARSAAVGPTLLELCSGSDAGL